MTGPSGPENGYGLPKFQIALPPGWQLAIMSKEQHAADYDRAKQVFRRANRPDLEAEYRLMMQRAQMRMARQRVFGLIRQHDFELEEYLPLSITLAKLQARENAPLEADLAAMTKGFDAGPMRSAPWIFRWQTSLEGSGEMQGPHGSLLNYAIAAPGTARREAILLSATVLDPTRAGSDDLRDAMIFFADALVQSFRWLSDAKPAKTLRDELMGAQ